MIVVSRTQISLSVKDIQQLLAGKYLKAEGGVSVGIDFGTHEYELVRSDYGKCIDDKPIYYLDKEDLVELFSGSKILFDNFRIAFSKNVIMNYELHKISEEL